LYLSVFLFPGNSPSPPVVRRLKHLRATFPLFLDDTAITRSIPKIAASASLFHDLSVILPPPPHFGRISSTAYSRVSPYLYGSEANTGTIPLFLSPFFFPRTSISLDSTEFLPSQQLFFLPGTPLLTCEFPVACPSRSLRIVSRSFLPFTSIFLFRERFSDITSFASSAFFPVLVPKIMRTTSRIFVAMFFLGEFGGSC